MRASDLTGKRFGRLTVIERAPNSTSGKTMWYCACDCGRLKEKPVSASDLKSRKVFSCGCVHRESAKAQGQNNKTHGMTGTRVWNIWQSMKQRSGKLKNYKNVSVCKEWLDFNTFYAWASENGYADNLTLDRIDPRGNYEPHNCRWVSMEVQENNRRDNRIVTYHGEKFTLSQLSSFLHIGYGTLRGRLESGWPEDDLCIPPNLNNKNIRSGKYA